MRYFVKMCYNLFDLITGLGAGNKYSPTVIIAAISSKANVKAKRPAHRLIPAGNGLALPSIVLAEQIRTVDKRRLSERVGRLREHANIRKALQWKEYHYCKRPNQDEIQLSYHAFGCAL